MQKTGFSQEKDWKGREVWNGSRCYAESVTSAAHVRGLLYSCHCTQQQMRRTHWPVPNAVRLTCGPQLEDRIQEFTLWFSWTELLVRKDLPQRVAADTHFFDNHIRCNSMCVSCRKTSRGSCWIRMKVPFRLPRFLSHSGRDAERHHCALLCGGGRHYCTPVQRGCFQRILLNSCSPDMVIHMLCLFRCRLWF